MEDPQTRITTSNEVVFYTWNKEGDLILTIEDSIHTKPYIPVYSSNSSLFLICDPECF